MILNENIHEQIKKRTKKTALVIGAAVILLAAARLILTRFYVEPEGHFYIADRQTLVKIFDWAAAAGVLMLYLVSMFIYKHKKDEHFYPAESAFFVQGTQSLVFSALVSGFLLTASALLQVWGMLGSGQEQAAEILAEIDRNKIFDFVIIAAAVLSAVYFFKTAAQSREGRAEYSQLHIILSLMPVIWAFANTFKGFFDMSRSVNSPVRIYELMCFLALSAYFVSESRMIVGRRESSRFFTFAYIALIFILLSALPNLILSSFWIMQPNGTQIMYASQLALALYIASRVYSQIRYGVFQLVLI